jgi:hypothetical protein
VVVVADDDQTKIVDYVRRETAQKRGGERVRRNSASAGRCKRRTGVGRRRGAARQFLTMLQEQNERCSACYAMTVAHRDVADGRIQRVRDCRQARHRRARPSNVSFASFATGGTELQP